MYQLVSLLLVLFLSSCIYNPDGYLKRSANNKLIDTKGFNAKKRRPIYNGKYINQAKNNLVNNNVIINEESQDDISELEDIYKHNTQMYQQMISDEQYKNSQKPSIFSKFFKTTSPHADKQRRDKNNIIAQQKLDNQNPKNHNLAPTNTQQDLLKEVVELKLLLNETRTTLHTLQQANDNNSKNIQSSKKISTNNSKSPVPAKLTAPKKPVKMLSKSNQLNNTTLLVKKPAAQSQTKKPNNITKKLIQSKKQLLKKSFKKLSPKQKKNTHNKSIFDTEVSNK